MSIFSDALRKAFSTGEYPCPECGKPMSFEDEWRSSLVCDNCGYDCRLEDYGLDEDTINDRNSTITGDVDYDDGIPDFDDDD